MVLRYGSVSKGNGDLKFTKKRTPLPVRQLAVLLLLRFCESASTFVIFPFMNELISSVTGGDDAKVGYYAGLMESIRQFVSLVSVMYWSRLSDHIGRKPVLLLGTIALAISTTSFGLSRTFGMLVFSRCIFTALNSNAGVIKSTVGEITDHNNRADAFALLHVPWAVGSSFGALTGGWLARPHDHFPTTFTDPYWIKYPYFLPCSVMACLSLAACWAIGTNLKETVRGGYFYQTNKVIENESNEPLIQSADTSISSSVDSEEPVPLKSLLHWNILIPILNYVCLASLHAASNALQPLFLAMPIEIGGLGLPPRDVGYILGTYGLANSIFQTFMLGRFVRRFGVKKIFVTAICAFIPIFTFSPVMNILLVDGEISTSYVLFALLACQLSCSLMMELGYGCIYMFITAAAPNKRSLGATNGLAQTLVSIGRILTPVMSTSLLSLSIEYHVFWGYAAYLALITMTCGGVWLASQLPSSI